LSRSCTSATRAPTSGSASSRRRRQGDSAKLGAIKAQLDVAEAEVALLHAVNALPRNLGQVGEQLDVQQVLKEMETVFTKYAVPGEALQELAKVLSASQT